MIDRPVISKINFGPIIHVIKRISFVHIFDTTIVEIAVLETASNLTWMLIDYFALSPLLKNLSNLTGW